MCQKLLFSYLGDSIRPCLRISRSGRYSKTLNLRVHADAVVAVVVASSHYVIAWSLLIVQVEYGERFGAKAFLPVESRFVLSVSYCIGALTQIA